MKTNDVQYRLGQILYVILKKETRVYPMQVIEILSKKTLEGEVVNYMVRGGSDPKAQLLISDVDGEVFDSAEKAKAALINRATSSIVRLIDAAVQKANEWYPTSSIDVASSNDFKQISNLKKPGISPPPSRVTRNSDIMSEFQKELLQETPGAIEDDDDPQIVMLPDGTQAKVRSMKLPDPAQ
jgi:hypothetical protein